MSISSGSPSPFPFSHLDYIKSKIESYAKEKKLPLLHTFLQKLPDLTEEALQKSDRGFFQKLFKTPSSEDLLKQTLHSLLKQVKKIPIENLESDPDAQVLIEKNAKLLSDLNEKLKEERVKLETDVAKAEQELQFLADQLAEIEGRLLNSKELPRQDERKLTVKSMHLKNNLYLANKRVNTAKCALDSYKCKTDPYFKTRFSILSPKQNLLEIDLKKAKAHFRSLLNAYLEKKDRGDDVTPLQEALVEADQVIVQKMKQLESKKPKIQIKIDDLIKQKNEIVAQGGEVSEELQSQINKAYEERKNSIISVTRDLKRAQHEFDTLFKRCLEISREHKEVSKKLSDQTGAAELYVQEKMEELEALTEKTPQETPSLESSLKPIRKKQDVFSSKEELLQACNNLLELFTSYLLHEISPANYHEALKAIDKINESVKLNFRNDPEIQEKKKEVEKLFTKVRKRFDNQSFLSASHTRPRVHFEKRSTPLEISYFLQKQVRILNIEKDLLKKEGKLVNAEKAQKKLVATQKELWVFAHLYLPDHLQILLENNLAVSPEKDILQIIDSISSLLKKEAFTISDISNMEQMIKSLRDKKQPRIASWIEQKLYDTLSETGYKREQTPPTTASSTEEDS